MSKITDLQNQITKLSGEAKQLYADMEADAAKQTADNREKLDKIISEGKSLRERLEQAKAVDELGAFVAEPEAKKLELGDAETGEKAQPKTLEEYKSWGRQFTDSEEYQFGEKNAFRSPKIDGVEVKAIYEGLGTAGGAAVFSDRRAGITDLVPTAPTTLLDIMNVSQTNSNSIDYVRVTGFTNAAAEVNEYSAGNFGLKPESNLTFELVNAPVQTIAHWVGASRNILSDAPALRNLIDTKLRAGLGRRLEGQVVSGNGTAPNLRGILNTSGIQTRNGASGSASARYVAGDTRLDTIRRAITDVSLAFGNADAIVLHPGDAEALELQKDDNNNYMNVYDPIQQRVWRVRVVENLAMTFNRGLVGDFNSGAVLYMRENMVIRVSESHSDFFIRNAIVILAELRAALAVMDPEMFVDINTLS